MKECEVEDKFNAPVENIHFKHENYECQFFLNIRLDLPLNGQSNIAKFKLFVYSHLCVLGPTFVFIK